MNLMMITLKWNDHVNNNMNLMNKMKINLNIWKKILINVRGSGDCESS